MLFNYRYVWPRICQEPSHTVQIHEWITNELCRACSSKKVPVTSGVEVIFNFTIISIFNFSWFWYTVMYNSLPVCQPLSDSVVKIWFSVKQYALASIIGLSPNFKTIFPLTNLKPQWRCDSTMPCGYLHMLQSICVCILDSFLYGFICYFVWWHVMHHQQFCRDHNNTEHTSCQKTNIFYTRQNFRCRNE